MFWTKLERETQDINACTEDIVFIRDECDNVVELQYVEVNEDATDN